MRQLVGFRDGKKFINAVESGEVVALATIEKTFLPNVDVEETEKGPEGQALRKLLQPPAAANHIAADLISAAPNLPLG